MSPQIHTPRSALDEADEALVVEIGARFENRVKEATAYARKLMKVRRGLRKTGAPIGTLSKEEAALVKEAVEKSTA